MDKVVWLYRAEKAGRDTLPEHKSFSWWKMPNKTKAPIAKIADQVAGVFVPAVMGIGPSYQASWYFVMGDLHSLAMTVTISAGSLPRASRVSMTRQPLWWGQARGRAWDL